MKTAFGIIVAMMLYLAVPAQAQTWDKFLDAIEKVESRGNVNAVGDNGDSIGAYQIQRGYWQDAVENHPELKARGYEAVKDRQYARKIIRAYMERYAPKGATWEDLARIHNGGPKGHRKAATVKYWVKVQAALKGGSK